MARIYRVLALIAALLCGSPIICARAVRGGIVSDKFRTRRGLWPRSWMLI